MRKCFDAATKAKASGQNPLWNNLRKNAFTHKAKKESYNQQASAKILEGRFCVFLYLLIGTEGKPYLENNPTPIDKLKLDLHGQRVSEALVIAKNTIEEARTGNETCVRFIVGKVSVCIPRLWELH